jgi:CHAT domain-containing protein
MSTNEEIQTFFSTCLYVFAQGIIDQNENLLANTAHHFGFTDEEKALPFYISAARGLLEGHLADDQPRLVPRDQCRFLVWLATILRPASLVDRATLLHTIAMCLLNTHTEFCHHALREALRIRRRVDSDFSDIIDTLTQLAVVYDEMGRRPRADRLLDLACRLSDVSLVDARRRDACLRFSAALRALEGDMRTAMIRFQQAGSLDENPYGTHPLRVEIAWTIAICRQPLIGTVDRRVTLWFTMTSVLESLMNEWEPSDKFIEVDTLAHGLSRTQFIHLAVLSTHTVARLTLELRELDLSPEDVTIIWNNYGNALLGVKWNRDAIARFDYVVHFPMDGLDPKDRHDVIYQKMHAYGGIGFANYNLAVAALDGETSEAAFRDAAEAFDNARRCRDEVGSHAWFEGRIWACSGLVQARLGNRDRAFNEFAWALLAGCMNWSLKVDPDTLGSFFNPDSDVRLKLMEGLAFLEARHASVLLGKAAVHAVHGESLPRLDPSDPEGSASLATQYVLSRASVHRTLVQCLTHLGRHNEAEQAFELLKNGTYDAYVHRWTASLEVEAGVALSRAEYEGVMRCGISDVIESLVDNTPADIDTIEKLALALSLLDGKIGDSIDAAQRTKPNHEAEQVAAVAAELGASAARIRYLITQHGITIVVDADGIRNAVDVAVQFTRLSTLVYELRQTCRSSQGFDTATFRPLSEELYDILIRPVRHLIQNVSHLYLQVDRPLEGLSFAALFDGARYLCEDFSTSHFVVVSPSALNVETPLEPQIAIFTCSEIPGARLPGAAFEGEAIAAGAPHANSIVSISLSRHEDCTISRFLTQLGLKGQQRSAVHLATHADFNATSDALSILALADGALSIRRLRSSLERSGCDIGLFVLSACGTARQDLDVEGFSSTLVRSGVGTVLSTLWETLDATAPSFFEAFYAKCGDFFSPRSIAEALRQTQLAFCTSIESIDGVPLNHPGQWAPYVVASARIAC